MADIRTLTVDGTTYNIKDATARADIVPLQTNVTQLQTNVTTLQTNVTTLQTNTDDLPQIRENVENNTDDIHNLKSAFEAHEAFAEEKIGSPAVSITDISGYTLHDGALSSGGTWNNINSSFKYIVIPVPETGCKIQFAVAQDSERDSVVWCGATQYADAVDGASYYADDVLYRRDSATANYDIPYDVKYILLNTVWGGRTITFSNFSISKAETKGSIEDDVAELKGIVEKPGIKMLILGDSYSANEERYIDYLQAHMNITSLVNLGVSSAHLKDIYADRTEYPYDGRPYNGGTGNNNTFGNQIAKLERLMTGTDLDAGETQIYTSASQYPDIILIEGGKNDEVDANTDDYEDEMWEKVNAYSYVSGGSVSLIDTYLPIPYADTDRTNFAGAMHYLYGALRAKFPNAKIFFITPSGINYSNANHTLYMVKADQMRAAARYLCTPTIDWDLEGRLSYVDNRVLGSGTQEDPYTRNASSQYTIDSLHPNWKGGELLGAVVCAKLRMYGLIN